MSSRTRILAAPAAAFAFLAMTACAHAEAQHAHAASPAAAAATAPVSPGMVHADVIGLDGKKLGMVMLQETPAGVLVSGDVKGLPAGEHGFHFHQKGLCDTATKFDSAGGHFTGGDHQHGYMAANGPHGGDMPNQHVGADGLLKTQILNTGVTLSPGAKSLFDADGTALVIHAAADDYSSQPSGNAGGRIACAVISTAK
ncbi:superoxide dismutase family protein [Novosphingobium sp. AP12]|uniref:superoxide dismutase family protein n=1 Tax=Novosphingobium sp. AP12 TaxID=1144305 RepID=UPI000271D856|nr:superoxide dismutase family protein [Novosphingobium sp. AP12]EJL34607.1 Cu/Zn superoxide dismutase [Novosphingobium sp. AP12]